MEQSASPTCRASYAGFPSEYDEPGPAREFGNRLPGCSADSGYPGHRFYPAESGLRPNQTHQLNRNLLLFSLSLMTWGIGEGMFIYFQPLYLEELGADPILIGTILGSVGMAMTISHLPAGYLSDRFGRRPLLWAAWVVATAATWLMALATSMPIFITGAIIYGITGFVAGPINGYITAARGKWSVARALTLISATYNTGAILGPLMGGWVGEHLGLRWTFVYGGILLLLSTGIILLIHDQPVEHRQPEENQPRWKELVQIRFSLFMGIVFFTMFMMYLPQPLSLNFLKNERGLDVNQMGSLISARSAGVVLLSLVLGQMNARFGFLIAQFVMVGFTFVIWRGNDFPWYLAGYFLLGSYQTARILAAALARSLVKSSNMGLAYGALETISGLVIIFGSPLAGFFYSLNPTLIYRIGLVGTGAALLISVVLIPQISEKKV